MDINQILKKAANQKGSDIHLKVGSKPVVRVSGSLDKLEEFPRISPEMIMEMGYSMMTAQQKAYYMKTHDLDMAYSVPGLGRFRVNVFQQRGNMGMVLRIIPTKIQTIRELQLPDVIEKIATEERGLILVTGTTGSGKSTTLASIIDHMNATKKANIVTVEDPIEFMIRDKQSLVNQRELGVDTISFAKAIKSALRQDPDIMLVGEMRDLETIETALTAAETGHLVLSTLHTMDAPETINRIVSVFPPHQQKQIGLQLSSILKAVISQRLIPTKDGGRAPAVEVMMVTPRIKEMIADPLRRKEIRDAIADGFTNYGMQTFDQSLMGLISKGLITYEDALRYSSNPDDFALKMSGVSGGSSDSKWSDFSKENGSTPKDAPVEMDMDLSFGENFSGETISDADIIEDFDVIETGDVEELTQYSDKKPEKQENAKRKKFDFSQMDDLF